VTQQDHEESLRYQQEKARQQTSAQARSQRLRRAASRHPKVNRRNFPTVVAGTAAVGEAAALGYSVGKDQNIRAHGARHAGDTYTEAQRHNIERELVNPGADAGGRGFGDWVFSAPTKMGAGPTL
jgi:hypothetical protein